jgi:acyl carrier protein
MYAAANTFMDTLMAHRASSGMHGLSIAWGPWARVGMAARSDAAETAVRKARGVRPIAPESALLALERLLVQAPAHVLCVSADWNAYARSLHAKRMPDYLRALVQHDPNASLGLVEAELGVGKEPGALRSALEQTPVNQRLAVLSRYVRALLARTLRFSSSDRIDPRQGFFDMGVDSLSAVELKNRLEAALGAKLLTTTLLDFATPEALVLHIHGLLAVTLAPPSTEVAAVESEGHGA